MKNVRVHTTVLGCLIGLWVLGANLSRAETPPPAQEPFLISQTPIKLIDREPTPRGHECQNCHQHKPKAVFPRQGKPIKEHGEISNIHGTVEVSCHNCHDPNNSNFLRPGYSDKFKADFTNPSPVCSTCHAVVFQNWRRGLHGKRMSGKDHVREQLHCVNCHNPHSVKFKKMQALEAPRHPKLLIQKHESEEGKEEGKEEGHESAHGSSQGASGHETVQPAETKGEKGAE